MSITGIKGMNDILPADVATWQFLEQTARDIFGTYGCQEIRVPVVEKTELFCRSIGETTDIVEKEMYTFDDKSDHSLTLRPEGTAPVMRSFIQHKLFNQDQVTKLYYMGPMFRYERPQKGRYRQFHQIGAEIIGIDDPRIDAQVLAMLSHYFEAVGIDDVSLQINSLGCPECRPGYRATLIEFLQQRMEQLCPDCQRRCASNPLRVLDCKAKACQEATVGAPSVLDHLCTDCETHFASVQKHLDLIGTPYSINDRMVRGLDYYTKTTFEMITNNLGSQNAVAAGGRYDGLIEDLGGPSLPGIGFAMGVERLALLLEGNGITTATPKLFIAAMGSEAENMAFSLLNQLQHHGIHAEMDFSGKSLKAQLRRANKLKCSYTLFLGENELADGNAQLKCMSDGEQTALPLEGIFVQLRQLLDAPLSTSL